jgi:CspA family cold shock protein
MGRKPADEMAIIVEDLIRLLDHLGGGLKHGKYPESANGKKIAALLRKLADELDV